MIWRTLIILFSLNLFANSEVEILNNGACWFQDFNRGIMFASFPEGKSSFYLNYDEAEWMEELDIKVTDYQAHFFCGSGGVKLIYSLKGEFGKRCAFLNLNGKKFKLEGIFPARNDQYSGCQAHYPGELILGGKFKNIEHVHWWLGEIGFHEFENIDQLSPTQFKLNLGMAYHFKEEEMALRLKSRASNTEEFNYIELSYINLWEGETKAFELE